jgi:hypothetical protein
MKHLLNDLSEEEKNRIREQHTGGKKIMIENFNQLLNKKLGEVKPLINEQEITTEPKDNKQELENEIEALKKEILDIRKQNFKDRGQELKNKMIGILNKIISFINRTIEKAGNKIDEVKLRELNNKKEELIRKKEELERSGNILTDNEKISIISFILTALAMVGLSILLPGSPVYAGLQKLFRAAL